MRLLFLIYVFAQHHKTNSHKVVHLHTPHKIKVSHIDLKVAESYKDKKKNPLVRQLEEAEELDKKTLEELKRPITEEMLHNPNIPIYEPYNLTEAQQIVLLSHE